MSVALRKSSNIHLLATKWYQSGAFGSGEGEVNGNTRLQDKSPFYDITAIVAIMQKVGF
jgi:hypothetical protein